MIDMLRSLGSWANRNRGLVLSLVAVAVLRLWFAAFGAFIILAHGSTIVPNPPTMYHGLTRVPDSGLALLVAPWQRWDAIWYMRVAAFGYSSGDASGSFFPLYPMLLRALGWVLGNDHLVAALLVSTLAAFGSFLLIYHLTSELIDERAAARAVVYLAVFPTAFFLMGGYAEPLLIVSSLAALYYVNRRQYGLAAVAAAAATLARPVGFLIALPVAIQAWESGGSVRERIGRMFPVLGVITAMAGWMIYLQIQFGDALMWIHAEGSWQRIFVFPGQTVLWTIQDIVSGEGAVANNFVDLALTLVVVLAVLAGIKRLPLAFSAYALLMIAVPLLNYAQGSGYALAPMAAAGRRALVVFPAFIALAAEWRGKWREPLWVITAAAIQLFLFAGFVRWQWVD